MYAITGADGFIGRNLCHFLDQKNIKYKAISRKETLGFESIGDINEFANWDILFKNVDTVFHLASKAHVFNINVAEYENIIRRDINGIRRFALEASYVGVKRLIYLSSVKVCGEKTSKLKPFSNSSALNPSDIYSKYKAESEIALKKVSSETGLEIVIIRPPLVYGPGVKANFLYLMDLSNKSLVLPLGGINNKRSIIYVENLIDFMYLCAKKNEAVGRTFLIADPYPISTSELIKKISNSLNKRILLFRLPKILLLFIFFIIGKKNTFNKLFCSLEIDPKDTYQNMDWNPKITLDAGLKITANWYLKNK